MRRLRRQAIIGPLRPENLESRHLLSAVSPTAAEQAFLEQLNDARANPAAYGASIGLDLTGVAPSPPLAFDGDLMAAALGHSQDMNAQNYFDHDSPQGITPDQRVQASGYPGSFNGESIAAGTATAAETLAALIIDTGVPDLGHRKMLLSIGAGPQDKTQVGVGDVLGGTGGFKDYWTIDAGRPTTVVPELTGAIYADANRDGHYEEGDGLPNMQVAIAGVGTVPAYSTGGFDIPLNPGTYSVTVSGPGLASPITKSVTIGSTNVKLDFIAPTPGQWTTLASLPAGSDNLQAATGGDGKIYVVGTPNNDPMNTAPFGGAVAYDPAANTWTTLADLPDSAGSVAVAAGGDGRVYAVGGLVFPDLQPGMGGTDVATPHAVAWSPSAGAWQNLPDEPTARAGAVAATGADGRVYVFGGYQVDESTGNQTNVNSVDVYSPQTNTWTSPTSLPRGRIGFAAVGASDGRIYIIGGFPPDHSGSLSSVDVYSPATNSWTQAADAPLPLAYPTAAAGPGGTIVLFGGESDGNNNSGVYVYSPASNVWTAVAPLPTPALNLASATGADGRIYAIGGYQNTANQQGPTILTTVEALTLPAVPVQVPATLGQVAQTLTHSAESYSYFITQAYLHYLGRGPDSAGLSYWVNAMQNGGVTDEHLEAGFLGSAEYIANHGGNGAGWVKGMYQDLLGRPADPDGLTYWTNALQNGANPADVAYGFAASAERETQRINADYQTYLGRPADSAGLSFWLNAFLNGQTNETLVGGFVGSSEYFMSANQGDGSVRKWIDAAFHDIFHRAATADDEAYWMSVLG